MSQPMIEVRDLSKRFGEGDGAVHALEHIDLTVDQGDIYGIIGLSGAGKSTLVRCINLLERPTEGTVLVDGRDLTRMPDKELRQARKSIGMIFQHFNLLMQRNCLDNITFPLELTGTLRKQAVARARELLKIVDLESKEKAYPAQLSGGQKQRIAIARALASDPKVLLCDEATSALDPTTTRSILRLIQDINKRLGITIVVITHEMAVVKEICHRVAVIESGVIKEMGRVVDIFTNPQSQTMKDFVTSIINMELPAGIKNLGVTDQPSPDRYMLVRLRFKGAATNDPVVADVVRKFNVEVSVLYGNIDYIQDEPFGYLIVVIMGDMETQAKAFSYIKTLPIGSEVLGYVPRNN